MHDLNVACLYKTYLCGKRLNHAMHYYHLRKMSLCLCLLPFLTFAHVYDINESAVRVDKHSGLNNTEFITITKSSIFLAITF